jgi:hypothetical protein
VDDAVKLQAAADHLIAIGFLSRRDVLRAGGVNLLWGLLLQARRRRGRPRAARGWGRGGAARGVGAPPPQGGWGSGGLAGAAWVSSNLRRPSAHTNKRTQVHPSIKHARKHARARTVQRTRRPRPQKNRLARRR